MHGLSVKIVAQRKTNLTFFCRLPKGKAGLQPGTYIMDKKKALLIVNPCSGKNSSRAGGDEIVSNFPEDSFDFELHETTCQGDATNIVKRELTEEHSLVVCCGGDGTLNETINGVMDMPRRVPIGYVPAGTTNDIASSLSIPTDFKKATELIVQGEPNDYDIGLFNNRYYSYVASFGAFSAASYVTSQKMKNLFGRAAYITAGVADLKNVHNIKMRVEYDGGIIEGKFVFGTVSNSLSVGGFIKLPEDQVKFNDGKFEVILVRDFTPLRLLPMMYKTITQKYDGKEVIMFSTNKIKFTALEEDVPWTIDGEFAGNHREVRINVLERAIELYSPQTDHFLPKPEVIEPFDEDAEKQKDSRRSLFRRKKSDKAEESEEAAEVIENPVEEIAVAEDSSAENVH